MGYTTEFEGRFELNNALDMETFNLLNDLASTRRMKRNVDESIYGVEGEFYVESKANFGQNHEDNIIDYNNPPRTQPSLWLQWIPTKDGKFIEWDGNEKFYSAGEWIIYLIERILSPRGYVLNGLVNAYGEERGDVWHIEIKDNKVVIGDGEKIS